MDVQTQRNEGVRRAGRVSQEGKRSAWALRQVWRKAKGPEDQDQSSAGEVVRPRVSGGGGTRSRRALQASSRLRRSGGAIGVF